MQNNIDDCRKFNILGKTIGDILKIEKHLIIGHEKIVAKRLCIRKDITL